MIKYISFKELQECFSKVETLFKDVPDIYTDLTITTRIKTKGGFELHFEYDKGDITLVTQIKVTNYEIENEEDIYPNSYLKNDN